MTRLHPAAITARVRRALVGIGAVFVLALAASGCAGSPSAAPTPDPFAGLADRSDQAFREGLEAYGAGQYREALTAFERARVNSPSGDPRITQMIDRSRAALAPTATPVPATATPVPVVPTATPVTMSKDTPDTELGRRYFGLVTLAMVPGRDTEAPAATQFFFQDQIGLRIDGLKEHLRLPFTLRVFNTDTALMVAQIQSDDSPGGAALATFVPQKTGLAALVAASQGLNASAPAVANPTAVANDFQVARFWDTYVWYHKGGEEPGRYRAELFANGVLTNSFDYTVGSVPVPTPEVAVVVQPTVEPTAPTEPSLPRADAPPPPAPVVVAPPVAPRVTQPVAAPIAPTAVPEPTAIPSPTPVPTPQTAGSTVVGGLPAGLDVNPTNGRVFIADGSGVLWATDPAHPTIFNRPVTVGSLPVDLAVDPTTGFIFVSARNEPAVLVLDANFRRLSTIPMPVGPGDLQLDANLGLIYVVLPERQALGVIDVRGGRLIRTVDGLPQVTSLALDPERHTLYVGHLGGQLTMIDVGSSQVMGRVSMTGAGLTSVATSRGLVYGVNAATHEFAVMEPISQGVIRYMLAAEPAAVAASEETGSVYVLSSKPNAILRLDPTDATELGRVTLPDRSGRFGIPISNQADFQGLRARMVLNRYNESLYLTLPEAGSLSVVPTDLFPPLTRSIPWVESPQPAIVASIPGVIRPGAPPPPSQPAPAVRAQAPNPNDEEAN